MNGVGNNNSQSLEYSERIGAVEIKIEETNAMVQRLQEPFQDMQDSINIINANLDNNRLDER